MYTFRLPFTLLLLWLLGTAVPSLGQAPIWTQHQKTTPPVGWELGSEDVSHVTDSAGNSYVLTLFHQRLVLGNTTIISHAPPGGNEPTDILLTKYSASGQKEWHRQIYHPRSSNLHQLIIFASITLDAQEQPVLLISRRDPDPIMVNNLLVRGTGPLLVKFSQSGSIIWTHSILVRYAPSLLFTKTTGLSADSAGNLYFFIVAGDGNLSPYSIRQVDQLRVDSTGRPTHFILLKYNSAGQLQWLQPVVGLHNSDYPYKLAVSPGGNSMFIGTQFDTVRIGSASGPHNLIPPIQNTQLPQGFIACLGPNGNFLSSSTTSSCVFLDLKADQSGNFYTTGNTGSDRNWRLGQQARPNRGLFVAKLLTTSQAAWITQPTQPIDFLFVHSFLGSIDVDNRGRVLVSHSQYYDMTYGTYPLRMGTPNLRLYRPYLVQLDPQGRVEWATNQTPDPIDHNWYFGLASSISHDNAGNAYWVGVQQSFTSEAAASYYNGVYIQKLRVRSNNLSGGVYIDRDANGVRSPGEESYPNPVLLLNLGGPASAVAEAPTSIFSLFVDSGRYDLQMPTVPRYHRLTQGLGGYQRNFAGYNLSHSGLDFGLAPIPNQPDVRVTLTPYTPARQGITTRYRARLQNIGTTTIPGGQLTVRIDPLLAITGTVPPANLTQPQVRGWNFTTLPPLAARDFDVTFEMPTTLVIGSDLVSSATVTLSGGIIDVAPSDNADTLRQTIIGPFDPNDIAVNYSTLTTAQIAAGVPLDYTVRFENLGTGAASSVYIQDTLPAHLLQLNTLELISQSHPASWTILDSNVLEIRFPSIWLPNRSADSVRSNGFARFRVVPRRTLGLGTVIPSQAHIVFDYNAPVATNYAITLVQNPTGLPHAPGATALSLYPNPATERTLLTADLSSAGTVQVRLTDALGREMRRTSVTAPAGAWQHPVSTNGLTPGVYGVRLMLPDGATVSRRLVVQ